VGWTIVATNRLDLMRQDALLRPYRALHGRIFNGSNGTNGSNGSKGSHDANGSNAKTERKVRSVLFTASSVGEGCSTLAGNMAIYLTKTGPQRVLLLELDAFHPARNPVVPAPRAAGVSDVLDGSATLEEAVHQVPGTNLFVLASGTPREDAPELFSEAAVGELMKRLTSEYDFVVADGPTVNGVPRIDSLAPHFDGVALVTQANRTRRQVVARSVETLKGASENFLGLVLNQRRFFIPAWIYGRL
jgi:capsular exopolysaccharide synthesis family protein